MAAITLSQLDYSELDCSKFSILSNDFQSTHSVGYTSILSKAQL